MGIGVDLTLVDFPETGPFLAEIGRLHALVVQDNFKLFKLRGWKFFND